MKFSDLIVYYRAVLPNQWVAKLFQVGREAFLNVTVFY